MSGVSSASTFVPGTSWGHLSNRPLLPFLLLVSDDEPRQFQLLLLNIPNFESLISPAVQSLNGTFSLRNYQLSPTMSYQNSDAPPPAYDEAVSTGNTSRRYADDKSAGAATQHYPADNKSSGPDPSRLQPHNGIPPQVRRSMEDEQRPLPPGI